MMLIQLMFFCSKLCLCHAGIGRCHPTSDWRKSRFVCWKDWDTDVVWSKVICCNGVS